MGITSVGDQKLIAIANGDKLGASVGLVVRYVVEIGCEVIHGTRVRNPGGLVRACGCSGSHGSKFGERMLSLI